MKMKISAMILSVILIALIAAGCGAQSTPSSAAADPASGAGQSSEQTEAQQDTADAGLDSVAVVNDGDIPGTGTVSEGLEVTDAVAFAPSNYQMDLEIKNSTGKDCDIKGTMDFFDAQGKLVGTEKSEINGVAQGTTVLLYFGCDVEFARYEYKLTAKDVDFSLPVDPQLTYEYVKKDDLSVDVTVTNNADYPAHFVGVYVLFLRDGQTVDVTSSTCSGETTDVLMPGETGTVNIPAFNTDSFDDVKLYVHGTIYRDDTEQ